MLGQLFHAFWVEFLPILFVAAVFPAFFAYVYKGGSDNGGNEVANRLQTVSILYSISLLGIVTGQITSQSREPAIAAVMPAVLGLIGGISIYILTAKNSRQQMLAAILVIAFTGHLLAGMFIGRELRKVESGVDVQYRYLMDQEIAKHKVAMDALQLEVFLRTEREILELPALEALVRKNTEDE